MDLFDALAGRTSIRKFKDQPAPDEDVWRILDAGWFSCARGSGAGTSG
jgi:nitroreductase